MNIMVFSGAGISAESGIPTYRDVDGKGIWEEYDVEEVATAAALDKNPELVLDFFNARRSQILKCEPNAAHIALVELEKKHNVTVITQNIDNLHEKAGSSEVIHLHGEIMKGRIVTTNKIINWETDAPMLLRNGVRPDVVLFDEAVKNLEYAAQKAREADITIIAGTSLNVFPASSIVFFPKITSKRFLIDPADCDSIINFKRLGMVITHIKKVATQGVPEVVKELLE